MNDSRYAYRIIRNLIEINRRLVLSEEGSLAVERAAGDSANQTEDESHSIAADR